MEVLDTYHCMYKIKTFSKDNYLWVEKLNEFRLSIKDSHYRIDNYKKNWPKDGHLAYSVFLDDDDRIYGFSTVYSRDFYPKNHARILNRYYIDPDNRSVHINKRLDRSVECAISQIAWCIQNSNLDIVFLSYEGYKPHWIKKWTSCINQKLNDNLKFTTDDNFYQTCNTETKLCWHHVSYCCLKNSHLLLNKITYNKWKNLKDE